MSDTQIGADRPRAIGWPGGLTTPSVGPVGPGRGTVLGDPLMWMLVLFSIIAVPSLDTPIVDHHSFRQTQTAMYTRGLLRSGFDLFHPQLQSFGARGVVPFEFPWYSAIAALLVRAGLSETVALRSTSLAFTLIATVAIARLVTLVSGRTGGRAAAAAYLFCPFTFVWGQASMIESFTVAACLWWILVARHAVESTRTTRWYLAANAVGIIAVTSKSTTALSWLPVLFVALRPWAGPGTRLLMHRWMRCASVTVLPVVSGALWTKWSDGLRGGSVLSAWLTNASLGDWYFGPLSMRANWANWATIFGRVPLIVGFTGLAVVAFGLLSIRRQAQPLLALSIAIVPLFTILIFFNLYWVHDYYLAAIAPAFACLFGCGYSRLARALTTRRRASFATLVASAQLIGFGPAGLAYVIPTLGASLPQQELTTLSSPDEGVVVTGQGWDPEVHYLSDRRGVALQSSEISAQTFLGLPETETGPISLLYVGLYGVDASAETLLRAHGSVFVVGRRTYRWAPSATFPKPLLTWTRAKAPTADGAEMRLTCDGEMHRVAAGAGATRFTIATDLPGVWLQFDEHIGAVPVGRGTIGLDTPTPTARCFVPPLNRGTTPATASSEPPQQSFVLMTALHG